MPKKTEKEAEEIEGVAGAVAKDVNKFLAEESADSEDVEAVKELVEDMSSTTKLLSALAEVLSVDFEDEVGATLVRSFRVRFAAHEMISEESD